MHEIALSVHDGGWIRASCSCGRFNGEAREVTLDRLTEAVDEHIEIEEAADQGDLQKLVELHQAPAWAVSKEVGGVLASEGYGTKSAITSEDQLIDIETGRQLGAIVRDRLGT